MNQPICKTGRVVPFRQVDRFHISVLSMLFPSQGPSFKVPPAEALLLSCPQERVAEVLNQLQVALAASDASEEERASNSSQIIEQWTEETGTTSVGEFLAANTTPMVSIFGHLAT